MDTGIHRHQGVGGSEAAAVCGYSRWSNPTRIWLIKTGRAPDFGGNLATRLGTFLESFVAQEYSNATGKRLKKGSLRRHPTEPYMLGTPDFYVIGEDRGLEIKYTGRLSDDWGPAMTDMIPIDYLFQVQQYMAVCDLPFWDVAVMESTRQFRIYSVARDPEFIGLMADDEERFWVDHVLADRSPEMDSPAAIEAYLKAMHPTETTETFAHADQVASQWSDTLKMAKIHLKSAEEEKNRAEFALKLAIGDASGLIGEGFSHSFKASKPSKTVDWQALALHLGATPADIAQFMTDTPGSRRFVPTWTDAKETHDGSRGAEEI